MGGSPDNKFGTEQLIVDPATRGQLDQGLAGLQSRVGQAQNAAQAAVPKFQTNFGQYTPQLNTEFKPSGQLDAMSQALVSQGHQDAASRLGSTQQQIAQKFGGSNQGLSDVLQQQAAIQSQLGTNPLLFQAGAAQTGREFQAQQLTNEARAAQGAAGAQGQSLSNAALAQQVQLAGIPAEMQQNLLGVLASYAALLGRHSQRETSAQDVVDATQGGAGSLGPLNKAGIPVNWDFRTNGMTGFNPFGV